MSSTAAVALAEGTAPAPTPEPWWTARAEIDTSAPFESVREAVDRFGGSGLWKPKQQHFQAAMGMDVGMPPLGVAHQECPEEEEDDEEDVPSLESVEKQTALLEKDLAVKERQTLEVLKELETTKRFLDGLKTRLQKQEAAAAAANGPNVTATPTKSSESSKIHPISDAEEVSIRANNSQVPGTAAPNGGQTTMTQPVEAAAPSPGLILMELKQAKLNLTKTTSDLAGIRSSIESTNSELQREKFSLETARQRLSENTTLVSQLEAELSQTRTVLQLIKEAGVGGLVEGSSSPHVSRKLHELRSESEQFKRMAEAAGSDVLKLAAEIDKIKGGIKTVEVRLLAARKVEEAARATEVAATAGINAVMKSEAAAADAKPSSTTVTLSVEEYNKLIRRAQEAEAESKKKIQAAVAQVEEADRSKSELMKKVDDAKAGVRMRKKVLSEALCRVEVASKGKLAAEEAMRKWRSDGQRRRSSVHSSPRFKSSVHPTHRRRNSKTRDLCTTDHVISTTKSSAASMPMLSIGQILSRKLMGPEDFVDEEAAGISADKENDGPKMSLGQMLSRRHAVSSSESNGDDGLQHDKHSPENIKKKKFAFVGFPLVLAAKQERKSKKKKNRQQQSWSPN